MVYDAIIDDDRSKNAFSLMMSPNMLIETPGGFDYTGADCAGWMTAAGFSSTRVEYLVGPDSMVIGTKQPPTIGVTIGSFDGQQDHNPQLLRRPHRGQVRRD